MTRTALISAAALALVVATGVAAVYAGGLSPGVATPQPVVSAPTAVQPPTAPDVVEAPPPAVTPAVTPVPTVADREGDVAAVQQQLADLGYYVGAIDGRAGPATASAVQAFQKVNGLNVDGVVGPGTLAALADPVVPELRGGPPDRVEVDLDDQVLYLVQGGQLVRILPISSGSGDTYTNPDGGTARSLTPVGDFTVERHISGVRNAPLGTLYDPMYFYGGWAIHGSSSVPAHPASHGCVRVTRADARWLFDRVPIGTAVSVYGNTHAFSPSLGESAGTSEPAGDTPETTPYDGIQTEEPVAPTDPPAATEPTAPPEPTVAPPPTASETTSPGPTAEPTPTGTAEPTPSAAPTTEPADPPPPTAERAPPTPPDQG